MKIRFPGTGNAEKRLEDSMKSAAKTAAVEDSREGSPEHSRHSTPGRKEKKKDAGIRATLPNGGTKSQNP